MNLADLRKVFQMIRSHAVIFLAIALIGLWLSCGKSDVPSPPHAPAPVVPPSSVSPVEVPKPEGENALPNVRQLVNDKITTMKASAAYEKKHTAQDAFDGHCNTAWNAPYQKNRPTWLEVILDEPVLLENIVLTAGWQRINAKGEDLFSANMQVRKVTLLLDEKVMGTIETKQGQRVIEFKGLGVKAQKVRLQFDQMWNGTTWPDIAISEVEIWGLDLLRTAENSEVGKERCDFETLALADEAAPNVADSDDTQTTTDTLFSSRFRNALAQRTPLAPFFADSWELVYNRSHRCDGSTDGSLAGLRSAQIDETVSLDVRDDGKGWTCKQKKPNRRKMDFSLKALLAGWDRFEVQSGNSDKNALIIVGEAESGYIKVLTKGSGSGIKIVKFEYHDEDPG